MTDPIHILVYIKRRLGSGKGTPHPLGSFNEFSLLQPMGHGYGQPWLFRLHERHQPIVIWLFSILRYQDVCLPPSLDARIQVSSRAHACSNLGSTQSQIDYAGYLLSKYRYAFEAHLPDSFYLPWNHFTPTLSCIFPSIRLSMVEPLVVPFKQYSDFVTHFQTPRRLPAGAAKKLECFAGQVLSMPRGFVSYRRREAPVLAMQVAARLSHMGVAPWWDQWAMPRTVAEETALLENKDVLSNVLDLAIQRAQYAVTLHTRTYGTPASPYTQLEFDHIKAATGTGSLALLQLLKADTMCTSGVAVDDALRVAGLNR